MVADQDPNRHTVYEAVLTARLSYVGKLIQARCTFVGLGPAGLGQSDEPVLVARLLKLPAPDIFTMAHTPVVLAKQMAWAM
eukprot:6347769-Alexandrium_andersonii.AAC.1